jgi:N-methylhydantoinase A
MLGAMPMLLSHRVAGRKGEYARTMSTIIDAFLHKVMYYGMSTLELNLRAVPATPSRCWWCTTPAAWPSSIPPMRCRPCTPARSPASKRPNYLATFRQPRQRGRHRHGRHQLSTSAWWSNGVKFYDFMPVIERWLVTVPMTISSPLGSGGGSDRPLRPDVQDGEVRPRVGRLRSGSGLL